ncbi:MAG TPA: urea ABC transporter permease subunit UrtC [Conexibacter sp.]|nr:urea ABC transporter permease subunit UrtC [Conexibacter sp.]
MSWLERLPFDGQRSAFLVRFTLAAAALLLVAPALLSDFRLSLLAKYLCFAIVAVGIGLAWGQGGMLVLGQGLFFGLGGYAMGMHMKLAEAGPGQLPDFMVWSGVTELPWLWGPFRSSAFAIAACVLVPMAVAALLGTLIFRQRVRGAYFAILSQALAAAFVIVLVGQQGLTGGTNGLTNFRSFFGLELANPADKRTLYLLVAAVCLVVFLLARQLVRSRYGKVLMAVRDAEDRMRFLGYDPTRVKVIAYAAAAGMAGLAGALFVPVVGIMSPALLGIVPSIEMVIWVALGGRTVLAWAAAGAIVVNWAKTDLSERFPSGWLYLQGALFVLVIAFAPKGLAGVSEGLQARVRDLLRRRRSAAPPSGGDRAAVEPGERVKVAG